jgi:hypothetical protein
MPGSLDEDLFSVEIRDDGKGIFFPLDTRFLGTNLEGVPLNAPSVLALIKDDLEKSLADIMNKLV